MDILDETVKPENWTRDHKELKGNIYCGVGIWDKEKQMFIFKWDAGAESNTEKEKGEASDSFKRACVNWGIGRELYTAPYISIKPLESMSKKVGENTVTEFHKNKKGSLTTNTKFKVSKINYDEHRNIIGLEIIDNKKNVRFKGGKIDENN
jgi:hypothetical protein